MGATIFIIPARAGSKGLPGKNIKILGCKPLIAYSIEFALNVKEEQDEICVTTNDDEVFNIATNLGVPPIFKRPQELSSDTASSSDVISHVLNEYKKINKTFENIVLLQPTSPFRKISDYIGMKNLYLEKNAEMVVSVKVSKENPFFNLFKENAEGKLERFIADSSYTRRQDCPSAFAYNGSIYIVNVFAFEQIKSFAFNQIYKYLMPVERSIDIDTPVDWVLAEYYLNKQNENC